MKQILIPITTLLLVFILIFIWYLLSMGTNITISIKNNSNAPLTNINIDIYKKIEGVDNKIIFQEKIGLISINDEYQKNLFIKNNYYIILNAKLNNEPIVLQERVLYKNDFPVFFENKLENTNAQKVDVIILTRPNI